MSDSVPAPSIVTNGALTRTRSVIATVLAGVGLLIAPGLFMGSPVVARDYHEPAGATVLFGVIGLVLIGAAFAITPATRNARFLGLGVFAVSIILLIVFVVLMPTIGWRVAGFILLPLVTAVGAAGWLIARGRGQRAFLALLFALLTIAIPLAPSFGLTWALATIVPALVVWIGWAFSPPRAAGASAAARKAAASDRRSQTAVQAQAAAMQQWQAAYAIANPGQPIPAPPVGLGVAAQGTNVLAILALVFGILGGLVAIIFGHIALAQIKKTGQDGFGLAVAGLVLGYAWLAFVLVSIVAPVIFVLAARH
jgi:hypothetical protein